MYLQIKQLNKSYGSRRVVSDIDLTMEEGEILSLLGPSGCGKTTILRMIAGLITPNSGWIKIGDRILYDGKREVPVEDRHLGMVFQDYALWPHMTVARNIAFGMRLRRFSSREIAKKVQEMLELVNLPGLGNRYPYQLSGGQQQRVALARALATEPRVLLLDEPLSSLDTALREVMRTELVQIFRRLKITTINVTHDQDEAMSMSDRIMVLRDGQVQQVGTPTELYLNPNNVEGLVITGRVSENVQDRLNGRASLLCRPDDILVHQEARQFEHSNILAGSVLHSSFVGGRWHTLIAAGVRDTKPILAFSSFQSQQEKQVWLELPPEHCQIVPE